MRTLILILSLISYVSCLNSTSVGVYAFYKLANIIYNVLTVQDKVDKLWSSPNISYNDQNCTNIGSMAGSEDMAMGRGGILFISSGDLFNAFQNGSAAASSGAIWAMDVRKDTSTPTKVPLYGFPAGERFQPHGIHVSNLTHRLLAVNHRGDSSVVEIFSIDYNRSCLSARSAWSCSSPVSLTHLRTIQSHLFPRYGINDVVEGAGKDELYVTQSRVFPLPLNGSKNPASLLDMIQPNLESLVFTTSLRLANVFRCRWDEKDTDCEAVTSSATQFHSANGITISDDRKTIYVNDYTEWRIAIMGIAEDGTLVEKDHIDLPYAVDNIEMDNANGEILMGTVPDGKKSYQRWTGSDSHVPGGMLVARKNKDGDWELRDVVHQDGTKLDHISAAARYSDKVYLGSPLGTGLLLCKGMERT